MKFSGTSMCLILGLIIVSFGSGYLIANENASYESEIIDSSIDSNSVCNTEFEMLSMNIDSIASRLERNQIPDAGDIYMLRLSAADLCSFYTYFGYEDVGALNSHELALRYLEEICFDIMTVDFADYSFEEWCLFQKKVEPLQMFLEESETVTIDQALSKLDESLK